VPHAVVAFFRNTGSLLAPEAGRLSVCNTSDLRRNQGTYLPRSPNRKASREQRCTVLEPVMSERRDLPGDLTPANRRTRFRFHIIP